MLSKEAKRRNRIIYVLLANAGIICVSLCMALFSMSVAWFSNNKNVSGNGMQVQVKVDPNIMDISFDLYKYDFDQKNGIKLSEAEATSGENLSLNKYDNFIKTRNVNNNNIIRFNIEFGGTVSTTRKLNLSLKCLETEANTTFDNKISTQGTRTHNDGVGYKYNNGTKDFVCNNISNVIEFKYFAYTYTIGETTTKFNTNISIDESSDASVYASATNIFNNKDLNIQPTYFVNKSSNNFVKNSTSINLTVNNVNGATESMVFYLQYNYSESLIDNFLSPNEMIETNTGLDVLRTNATIKFIEDIESILFSSDEEAGL